MRHMDPPTSITIAAASNSGVKGKCRVAMYAMFPSQENILARPLVAKTYTIRRRPRNGMAGWSNFIFSPSQCSAHRSDLPRFQCFGRSCFLGHELRLQIKICPKTARLHSESAFKRPAECICALEPHRFSHTVNRLMSNRQALAGFAQPQIQDKLRRRLAKHLLEPSTKVTRGEARFCSERFHG